MLTHCAFQLFLQLPIVTDFLPRAVADKMVVDRGQPVTIDVLVNDVVASSFPKLQVRYMGKPMSEYAHYSSPGVAENLKTRKLQCSTAGACPKTRNGSGYSQNGRGKGPHYVQPNIILVSRE